MLHKTPESLTASERAKQLGIAHVSHGSMDAANSKSIETPMSESSLIGSFIKKITPAEVRAHVCELMNVFARSDGGYVLTTSHGIMPETPLDNIIALYETALGLCKPLGR